MFSCLVNALGEGPAQLGAQDSLTASGGENWPVQLLCTRT